MPITPFEHSSTEAEAVFVSDQFCLAQLRARQVRHLQKTNEYPQDHVRSGRVHESELGAPNAAAAPRSPIVSTKDRATASGHGPRLLSGPAPEDWPDRCTAPHESELIQLIPHDRMSHSQTLPPVAGQSTTHDHGGPSPHQVDSLGN